MGSGGGKTNRKKYWYATVEIRHWKSAYRRPQAAEMSRMGSSSVSATTPGRAGVAYVYTNTMPATEPRQIPRRSAERTIIAAAAFVVRAPLDEQDAPASDG